MKPLCLNNIVLKNKARHLHYLTILLIASIADSRAGDLSNPYASANRSPFVQIYGLPAANSAELTQAQSTRWALQAEAVSNFTRNRSGNEYIYIDGETHRVNLQLRHGLTPRIELGLDIPYLSHEGGGLDNFIDNWHEFFSLPDGGRSNASTDQLRYQYQQNGQSSVNITGSTNGPGDISMSLGYQLSATDTRQWALRAGVKLPTGNADRLTGSESTDAYLSVHVSDRGLRENQDIALHASIGTLWMSDSDVIKRNHEDWVVYGSTTVSWLYNQHISFKAQVDFHSAFYDSAVAELGDSSVQLILGGALQVGKNWVLDLSVSEDIAVDTAPDVVFQIGLTLTGD